MGAAHAVSSLVKFAALVAPSNVAERDSAARRRVLA